MLKRVAKRPIYNEFTQKQERILSEAIQSLFFVKVSDYFQLKLINLQINHQEKATFLISQQKYNQILPQSSKSICRPKQGPKMAEKIRRKIFSNSKKTDFLQPLALLFIYQKFTQLYLQFLQFISQINNLRQLKPNKLQKSLGNKARKMRSVINECEELRRNFYFLLVNKSNDKLKVYKQITSRVHKQREGEND